MSAGTHETAANANNKPRRKMIWIFGGAAAAVVTAGLLMQHFRAPAGQAASDSGAAAGTARVGGAKSPDVLAKVGKEMITKDAVADECIARHGKEVLDDLIHRLVIQQACEAQQITVTEQEVSAEIEKIAKRFNLDVSAWMQMLQAERNITPMQYRTSVIWPMVALRKLAGEQIDLSEEDVKKAFIREYGPRVKARVIMLDNMRRANDVWDEANRNPDDFEKLAQKYSIDPNSRALGGQVPPIPRYTGNENLEKAAFKLKEGELSGVVEIGTGRWVIMKCEGRTEPVVTDIEEVRNSLVDQLTEAKTQQAIGKVFEKIKEQTRVDNYLTRSSTGPGPGAGPTGGAAIQPVSATGVRQPAGSPSRPAAATSNAPAKATRN
ncbi:MAG: peptidylprolyl isomerase [Planctomycetota bacterium]